MSTPARPFIATIPHVVELILSATADLAYWQARLKPAGLYPLARAGRAEIYLSATDLVWMGKRSQELTIGLPVSERPAAGPGTAPAPDGLYLVHAFNSSRLLAFLERTFFQTPYYPAEIQARAGPPARLEARVAGQPLLAAGMAAPAAPQAVQDEAWQGTIYLPGGRQAFTAYLGGRTEVYPFAPADKLALFPRPDQPVFQWLAESGLAGQEWRLRRDARHARSATYRRG